MGFSNLPTFALNMGLGREYGNKTKFSGRHLHPRARPQPCITHFKSNRGKGWKLALNNGGAPDSSIRTVPGESSKFQRHRIEQVLEEIRQRLEEQLPTLFTSDSPDYELYSRDVLFEDPLNKFRGEKRYESNISFLKESFIFTEAKFILHSSRILPDRSKVRTRWTLQMTVAAFPWKPAVYFTGLSDYIVDMSSKLVVKHVDYWDSLSSSAFFSPSAVADLVSQCSPNGTQPFDMLPPLVPLRRTQRLQVWKFDKDVILEPVRRAQSINDKHTSILFKVTGTRNEKDVRRDDVEIVESAIAVARVAGSNPSLGEVHATARALRAAVSDAQFIEANDDDSWLWVRVGPNEDSAKHKHFVWMKLSHVSVEVETEELI